MDKLEKSVDVKQKHSNKRVQPGREMNIGSSWAGKKKKKKTQPTNKQTNQQYKWKKRLEM